MQPAPLLATSAAISLTVSLLAVGLGSSPQPRLEAATGDSGLHASLDEVLERLERLERSSLEQLAVAAAPARAQAPGAVAQEIEAAVMRLVDPSALARPETETPTWPGGSSDVHAAYRLIAAAGFQGAEANALWEEAAANGQLHALLAEMEAQMALLPETGDKHFQRAAAYYEAASALPWNEDGNWWVDSDSAFSQALELDPEHWEARYQKARNQSFWPVAYGGQAEAIRHFEVLIDQQEQGAQQPKFAQSYQWLGNLYDQQGRRDEALAIWAQGLQLFPGDAGLTKKLETL